MSERGNSLISSLSATEWLQGTEAIGQAGMTSRLWHRMRLDTEYRMALVAKIIELDIEIAGREFLLEYDEAFYHPATIIKKLQEPVCGYNRGNGYLLREEILFEMCEKDPQLYSKVPPLYPQKFFVMPLYKSMGIKEVRKEIKRRRLVSAGAIEGLCFAIQFGSSRGRTIYVLDAEYPAGRFASSGILTLTHNGTGDSMMKLYNGSDFFSGDYFLVKREVR